MWTRCWWATWVSGFFGIAGIVHVARWLIVPQLRIVIGQTEVPPTTSGLVGIVFLAISGGLLWLEAFRERAKRVG
ncbi:MAG: hypothetical protein A3I71_01125 [Omnitrophica WOR_2 bacterium RIFCSPLOWO2_02_FULL_63_16]|nr:MAG: hypothetical protein A2Z92_05835 [Omnitrophica WOR_2 bacterium GWA2_63_20]OGX18590.1 MAG: hypothetical protein A2105_00605 [Omnitrophica WOR_2 bacterium GWF2_63_9]OGX35753.1 MAG: hypothetical protein A3B73_03455 [Omnitrophica WOR_2 bacterium RIFCSPHIGHO2_02_FULL_63_39]OGX45755.1 MAG: hypothetical protein A3I71_01125 [Omnitrophica WOR_2 bacterium RIFCSPLOWO2_02_FULL_63_16]OGX49404.1 MAG: hypothetical protein A3G88_06275 [Omnitrophica WOR_2 bacterium RIFCSPLOWO2_12_FULL_63_16]HBQ38159.1 